MLEIGVDTGGTFTDFIYRKESGWGVLKVLSTSGDPGQAVLKGIDLIAPGKDFRIVHGSTVATNALLERKGAKTALITNKGFEDILEIGRQNRLKLYSLTYKNEPPVIRGDYCFGIPGRITAQGEEDEPLNLEACEAVIQRMLELEVDSVAVSLLFSFLNPKHEIIMGQMLSNAGFSYSLSHEIIAEFREYERTSTIAINSYVKPLMEKYINSLSKATGENNFSIMQSNGGQISSSTAGKEPVRTILSGPAGGVVGAQMLGRICGIERIITLDMGGTSTDVCLIDRSLPVNYEGEISGYPLKVPMIHIHTVGAGGGSIASLDTGGALKVGPESAGANPGPICYGNGKEITVTDANMNLGRLRPEHFLGGNMKIFPQRIKPFLEEMARYAGLGADQLAEGICTVTNSAMERAVRVISVERGYDTRDFTLFSFGGAGGMHAVFLARLLQIPKVLIPRDPGTLSAFGMLMANVLRDYSLTVKLKVSDPGVHKRLLEELMNLKQKGLEDLVEEGYPEERIIFESFLDMRYRGQSYEITVPFKEKYEEEFRKKHLDLYGYENRDRDVEIITLRLRARVFRGEIDIPEEEVKTNKLSPGAFLGQADVVFSSKKWSTNLFDRSRLRYGNSIEGPAIILEYSSTTVVPPQALLKVDSIGNLIIHSGG